MTAKCGIELEGKNKKTRDGLAAAMSMYYVVCAVACVSAGGIGHGSSDVNDTPDSNPRLPQMVYTYAKPNVSTILEVYIVACSFNSNCVPAEVTTCTIAHWLLCCLP